MDFLLALWRPILLSTLFVFVASNLMWMALPFWHAKDYGRLRNEDEVLKGLADAPSGQFVVPCLDWKTATPEQQAEAQKGPMGFLILRNPGTFSFPGALAKYALYTLGMVALVAYLAGLALPPGAHYMKVFRVVSTAGVLAFSFGDLPAAIWYGKPGKVALKQVVDGLIYGLLMGGTFGWLWPRV
jgi:hypothetical protein